MALRAKDLAILKALGTVLRLPENLCQFVLQLHQDRSFAIRPSIVAAAVCLWLTQGTQAFAQTTSWTGGSGDWQNLSKWNGGVPSSSIDAVIANSGAVQLLSSAATRDLTLGLATKTGTLEITSSGAPITLTSTRDAHIGTDGYGEVSISNAGNNWLVTRWLNVGASSVGTLTIAAGATVTSSINTIGNSGSASGGLLVSGSGSKLQSTGPFFVGYSGIAIADVSDGAIITNLQGEIGSLAGSNGTMSVLGSNSQWTNSGLLLVGREGKGTLNIAAGGRVTSTSAHIGSEAGGVGAARIDGSNSALSVSGYFSLGSLGKGTLDITGGARVSSVTADIGTFSASTGAARIAGTDSEWLSTGAAFRVGVQGKGTLYVSSGARMRAAYVELGSGVTGDGSASIEGAGAAWTNSGALIVGRSGKGSATVSDGGVLSNSFSVVGVDAGSSGIVTIQDAASTWTNTGSLVIGDAGNGTLEIKNGATVDCAFSNIASAPGSSGKVSISGTGSKWQMTSSLVIGDHGNGALTIANGANVVSGYSVIGGEEDGTGEVVIDGVGSKWTCNDLLVVSDFGAGSLTLKNGGQLIVSDDIGVAVKPKGVLRGTGTITAENVVNQGLVEVGDGIGALNVVGSYLQAPGSKLRIDISSATSYDRLVVSDLLALNGRLDIRFVDNFIPSPGLAFDIFDWNSRTGTLEQLVVPELPGTLAWDVTKLGSDGIIAIKSLVTLSGDYDENGLVNGGDFLSWQRQFGAAVTASSGADGDGSGIVDAADLAIWKSHFGTNNVASAVRVPEPSWNWFAIATFFLIVTCKFTLRLQ